MFFHQIPSPTESSPPQSPSDITTRAEPPYMTAASQMGVQPQRPPHLGTQEQQPSQQHQAGYHPYSKPVQQQVATKVCYCVQNRSI